MDDSAPFPAGSAAATEETIARHERDVAAVWGWMLLLISAAVLAHIFGGEPRALPEARTAVAAHRELLRAQQDSLRINEEVLRQTREELARLKKIHQP